MQTFCFTTSARIRPPEEKVVDFDAYCRRLEGEEMEAALSTKLQQSAKHRTFRRRLELICVFLEICVCIAILTLSISAIIRFFVL